MAQMRLPPHSLEAEQAVLGGLLLDNSAWDRIGDVVSESDFYRQDHRQILRAIVRQIAENRPADAVTVTEALRPAGEYAVSAIPVATSARRRITERSRTISA